MFDEDGAASAPTVDVHVPDVVTNPTATSSSMSTDADKTLSSVTSRPVGRQQATVPDDEDHDAITYVRVERPVYTRHDFIEKYNYKPPAAAAGSGDKSTNSSRKSGEILPKMVMRKLHRELSERRLPIRPSAACFKNALLSLFPFVDIMRRYSVRSDLVSDIMAGLIVGVMNIPQGMAYGMLAKLDPVYGLYVSFFPVICYFFFGTSKHISIGTFAVVSLMIGQVVEKGDCYGMTETYDQSPAEYSNETTEYMGGVQDGNDSSLTGLYVTTTSGGGIQDKQLKDCQAATAFAVTMIVGFYQILLGVLRFGFVATYLSDPLTRALTMSAAVHVATSQIRHMFGVPMGRFSGSFKLIYLYQSFFQNISQTNVTALAMCVVSMALIYSSQRWLNPLVKKKLRMPFPAELFVIIVGTMISYFAHLSEVTQLPIVGEIPTGIPPPSFPQASKMSHVASDAVGIAIVSFTISISMAKLFAKKHNYSIDPNQELLAYGITNTICSMLNCYASTASLSRSLVQESAGGKTQVAGLVSCSLLLVVLLAIGPLFYHLPKCILSAIVLVNLKGVLMQITDIRALYKSRQYFDLAVWIVTALSVILTDVDTGLYLGVSFSLLTVIFRSQRPSSTILGRIPHTDLYEDLKTYYLAREIPGIRIFRYGSSLYYANAEHFVRKLRSKTACFPDDAKASKNKQDHRIENGLVLEIAPDGSTHSSYNRSKSTKEHVQPPVYDVILDFSSVLFIDTVGVNVFQQALRDFKEVGVNVSIACCRDDVYDKLERAGTFKKADNCMVFLGIHDAVLSAVEANSTLYKQLKADANGILGSVFNVNLGVENEHDTTTNGHCRLTDDLRMSLINDEG